MAATSDDRILFQLKTRGPQTAAAVGTRLGMTSTGARQHLARLQADGLVEGQEQRNEQRKEQRQKRGRPTRLWRLTDQGHGRFPDRHSDLTLELIRSTQAVFGKAGLEKLVRHREEDSLDRYRKLVPSRLSLRAKLDALAAARSQEGYMARVIPERDGSFLLVEDHCPICAAAATCQALCRSELAIFQNVLGDGIMVQRIDHLLAGARRCAYRVHRSR
ncbi:metalloregulator ArsR/SmtB family transcription factor [Reyranella sp.]|uniref:helix-turn-helix transcriptional regulator n=1 Tax=Reyranella sp. TaxID=1929291 RepID=UPI001202CEA7|nr:metalloregulator ArsR/SmtB family transcription factor [Reyranella sp.]TAJ89296.1 MAG: transcriptional regulator [Reyranella sp.]